MKKHLKAIISMFLSLVLFVSAIPTGSINASAETKLSTSVTYEEDGAAIVTIKASDFFNSVRYTTDGSVPTKKSSFYHSPIKVTEKTLIRIAEFNADGEKVKGIKINVSPKAPENTNLKTGKISFDVTQLGGKALVELNCETADVEIRYTTDGTKPDENSELYENGIIITEKTKIRARAYRYGYKTTTTYAKTVSVSSESDLTVVKEEEKTESKTETETKTEEKTETKTEEKTETKTETKKEIVIEKDSEESSVKQKIDYKFTYMDTVEKTYVTLLPSKKTNVIRYTTDGSAVSTSSKKYSKRVGFSDPGVLRAKEYTKAGKLVATLSINVKIKCMPVEFTCTEFAVGTRTIKMSTATEGADIYYTTDFTTPDPETSPKYTGEVVFGDAVFVKAIAIKDGGYRRSLVSEDYVANAIYKPGKINYDDPVLAEAVDLFNYYRTMNFLPKLEMDKSLTTAAMVRAKEISIFFSNTRPSGRSCLTAISEYGGDFQIASEFVYSGNKQPSGLVGSVVNSELAESTIYDRSKGFDKIGVGYYKTKDTYYWVVFLGRT